MKDDEQGSCPIIRVIVLLSDRWSMLILRALNDGPKRFSDLETWLPGVSTRTLTIKLKRLVTVGLIEKTAGGLYQPTQKGCGLKIIERAMIRYSKQYLQQ